jgi:oligopeptide/dipeptide ABC transporter ATP-binding protein
MNITGFRMKKNAGETVVDLQKVCKWFPVKGYRGKKVIKAVENVNLRIMKGETQGIVGESGCGKSTLARLMLRLHDASSGDVLINGENITKMPQSGVRKMRRHIQMIFQDPYASLNPRMRVEAILSEPYIVHEICPAKEARTKASELLEIVGLPQDALRKFPHEFSGGQRQRICIARALAISPEIIVCDECVSALDVSVQAQIINMLQELQMKYGITLIFISHDLRVVKHISDKIAVMYLGEVIENAYKRDLFEQPSHPYTKALLSAIPISHPDMRSQGSRIHLEGELPNPIERPDGCSFSTRCTYAKAECYQRSPAEVAVGEGHFCKCFYPLKKKLEGA